MIINSINAGLGNQLFQYALGCHLSMLRNTKHKIDISKYNPSATPDPLKGVRFCGLQNFNITAEVASKNDMKKFWLYLNNRLFRKLVRICNKYLGYRTKKYVIEMESNHYTFQKDILTTDYKGDVYLEGFWCSEKYFIGIEDIIRKEFTFKDPSVGLNKELIEKMRGENAVCIHIRHGDNAGFKGGVVSMKYYDDAMEYIKSRVSNPVFYVFSDDIEWSKNNLSKNSTYHFVSHNDDSKNYEDLRLMTHCKHHIIGNSSFSWWGAWLAKNEGQIVIAPQKHHSSRDLSSLDYIPEKWIVMKA